MRTFCVVLRLSPRPSAVVGYFVLFPTLFVGLIYFPWSLIAGFVNRPRSPLAKTEFITATRVISSEAKEIKVRP